MSSINIDGTQLFYRWDGPAEAPVLILSNSLGTDHRMWELQMPALSKRFRVLRYDTRGHGASAPGEQSFLIDRLGRDVVSLMDRLDIARAHFCGLSLGGMTGMWLGTHAAARIDRLVLANTAAHIGPAEMWTARADAVLRDGMQSVAEAVLKRWFSEAYLARDTEELRQLRATLLAVSPLGYARACHALRDMDQRQSVAAITAPTLVIIGTQDVATPPQDGRELTGSIKGARLVEFDAPHISNIERPTEFTAALLAHLNIGEVTEQWA